MILASWKILNREDDMGNESKETLLTNRKRKKKV